MLSECVIYVLVFCVCVCDTVHVFTQQEIGLGFRTGETWPEMEDMSEYVRL